VLADPSCVEVRHTRLDIELAGTETAGATSVDFDGMLRRQPNAWVATVLDVDRFWGLVESAVARLG
ncbi:MAG TPA: nucleoside hydrolase, partial [Agromyces sp.]